jgi:predicted RNase H-like HicB family nuclease
MNLHLVTSEPSNLPKLTEYVLIEKEKNGGGYTATVLGWLDCKAEGNTREEALTNLHQLLTARLEQTEIVTLEIEPTKPAHPWMKFAGKYKDDPQFDEMLAYIEEYRRELDAETEAYYSQLEADEEAK